MYILHKISALLIHLRNASSSSLLGDCFLERTRMILIQGSSGAGKSKFVQALCAAIAAGIEFLGIRPSSALRVMLLQAEDSVDDLAESFQGFCKFTLNDDPEAIQRVAENLTVVSVYGRSGSDFLKWVDTMCETHKPDVLVLDPLLAFMGCDMVDQKAVTEFLRGNLQPILMKHNCGCIAVHHKRKGKKGDGPDIDQSLGSMEFAAFARGIISLDASEKRPQELTVRVPKRHRQLGWLKENGELTDEKYLMKGEDGVYFTEVAGFDLPETNVGGRPSRVDVGTIANFIHAERAKGANGDTLVETVAKTFNYSMKQAKRYVSATPAEAKDAPREVQTEFPF